MKNSNDVSQGGGGIPGGTQRRTQQDLIPDGQMDRSMTGWGTEQTPRVCHEGVRPSLLSRAEEGEQGMSLGGGAGTPFAQVEVG